ncbi:hypothetical protein M404DRAFT_543920 [Pisolithus tinctorius Marx 270]|uniref:Uncharacterized protein n=1 Tax=Pisolithus tinctorius Marx 270 TaxID=870435 RepID=A0A0C3NUL2_PISTI|nr:hypothetical protein M404DRAFT_543920 [Pisolithus tinctorius Marx 270]
MGCVCVRVRVDPHVCVRNSRRCRMSRNLTMRIRARHREKHEMSYPNRSHPSFNFFFFLEPAPMETWALRRFCCPTSFSVKVVADRRVSAIQKWIVRTLLDYLKFYQSEA